MIGREETGTVDVGTSTAEKSAHPWFELDELEKETGGAVVEVMSADGPLLGCVCVGTETNDSKLANEVAAVVSVFVRSSLNTPYLSLGLILRGSWSGWGKRGRVMATETAGAIPVLGMEATNVEIGVEVDLEAGNVEIEVDVGLDLEVSNDKIEVEIRLEGFCTGVGREEREAGGNCPRWKIPKSSVSDLVGVVVLVDPLRCCTVTGLASGAAGELYTCTHYTLSRSGAAGKLYTCTHYTLSRSGAAGELYTCTHYTLSRSGAAGKLYTCTHYTLSRSGAAGKLYTCTHYTLSRSGAAGKLYTCTHYTLSRSGAAGELYTCTHYTLSRSGAAGKLYTCTH